MADDIRQWIDQARQAGQSDEEIIRQMVQSGWTEQDARPFVVSKNFLPKSVVPASTPSRKLGIIVSISLLVIMVAAGAVYFFFLKPTPKAALINSSNTNSANSNVATNTNTVQISQDQQAFAADLQQAAKAELLYLQAKTLVAKGSVILSKQKSSYPTQTAWLASVQEQYSSAADLLQQMVAYDASHFTDSAFQTRATAQYKSMGQQADRLRGFSAAYAAQKSNANTSDSLWATAYDLTLFDVTLFQTDSLDATVRASSYKNLLTSDGYVPDAILQQATMREYATAVCAAYYKGKTSVFCPLLKYTLATDAPGLSWKTDTVQLATGENTYTFQYPSTYIVFSIGDALAKNLNASLAQFMNDGEKDYVSAQKCADVYAGLGSGNAMANADITGCISLTFTVRHKGAVELSSDSIAGTPSTLSMEKFSGMVWVDSTTTEDQLTADLTPKNATGDEVLEVQLVSELKNSVSEKQIFDHTLSTLNFAKR